MSQKKIIVKYFCAVKKHITKCPCRFNGWETPAASPSISGFVLALSHDFFIPLLWFVRSKGDRMHFYKEGFTWNSNILGPGKKPGYYRVFYDKRKIRNVRIEDLKQMTWVDCILRYILLWMCGFLRIHSFFSMEFMITDLVTLLRSLWTPPSQYLRSFGRFLATLIFPDCHLGERKYDHVIPIYIWSYIYIGTRASRTATRHFFSRLNYF